MEEGYEVDIETCYSIRFNKGKPLQIPSALLVEDMQGDSPNSRHLISKHVLKFLFVICDLAGSERRHFPQAVCDQLHHQQPHLWQGCQECFFCWWQQDAGAEEHEECPADTSGQAEGGEEAPAKRRRCVETVVEVDVHGTMVSLLCPSKRSQLSDVMVKLEPKMLAAVFKFLLPDCLEETSSRSYKKSGAFAKEKQKED